jgi:predicted GIY-YIG superfamily endonuclease
MGNNTIGYYEDPANGDGITRARTLRLIRSWHFLRSMHSLEIFFEELGKADFPGVYILFESKTRKIYIGEAKNIYNRLKTHTNTPEEKIKNWDNVMIINDGRPAAQSDFNDNVVRHTIELYLQKIFKTNKYHVVAQGQPEKLNPFQKVIAGVLIEELNFFLKRKGLIEKLIETREHQEVMLDDLKKIIIKNGYKIQEFSAYEAFINDSRVFIRPGSKKPKGWQITFRDVFKQALQEGTGHLLMPRGKIVMIPFSKIKEIVNDDEAFARNTIDIFIAFEEEKILLRYKKKEADITEYRVIKN